MAGIVAMKRLVIAGLLCSVLVGAALLFFLAPRSLEAPAAPKARALDASTPVAVRASVPTPPIAMSPLANNLRRDVSPSPRESWQPLPPATMPLAATFANLKARADRGEAPAACRIAADLNWCRYAAGHREAILAGTDESMRPRSGVALDARERQALLDFCAGVDPAWYAEQVGLTRQAALAGNLVAIEEYIRGDMLLADLHAGSFHFDDYVREAPQLADAAIQSGSLTAVHLLQSASEFGPSFNLLGRALGDPFDPDRACRLSLLYVLVSDHQRVDRPVGARRICSKSRQGLDEATARALEAEARDRFATWFQGRRRTFDLGGFGVYGRRWNGPDANALCTQDYIGDPMKAPAIDWGTGAR